MHASMTCEVKLEQPERKGAYMPTCWPTNAFVTRSATPAGTSALAAVAVQPARCKEGRKAAAAVRRRGGEEQSSVASFPHPCRHPRRA